MGDLPNRVQCPKCGANNFPSSEICWKCGERLRERPTQPQGLQPYTPPPPLYDPSHVEPGSPFPLYRSGRNADTLFTLGLVSGILSYPACFCCCIPCVSPVFSLAGIVLGTLSETQGDKRGRWVIVISGISLAAFIIGTVYAMVGGHHSFSLGTPGPRFTPGFPRGFPIPGP